MDLTLLFLKANSSKLEEHQACMTGIPYPLPPRAFRPMTVAYILLPSWVKYLF